MLRRILRAACHCRPGRVKANRSRALFAHVEHLDRREVPAVVLPTGFADSSLVSGLQGATSMAVAPDGRILVGEAQGTVRVVKDGNLLPAPFATFPADWKNSQGFLSVQLDPDFEANHYVYAYYVAATGGHQVNILSRVTESGDTMVPGSEKVIYESQPFKIPVGNPAHDGGHFLFGPDGKIYIPTGDMDVAASGKGNAQDLTNVFGKVLRLNPDGSIPTDNPFYNKTTGLNRAIYALGLRNPFTVAEQPSTGRIYINDVGNTAFEEIDELARGANYGWADAEGPSTNPHLTNPVYSYTHHDPDTSPGGTAVIGGAFYEPAVESFPSGYHSKYFFADYDNGWIRTLDPVTKQVTPFASGLPDGIPGLDVTPDGRVIYLALATGEIRQIQYAPSSPPLIPPLADQATTLDGQATFHANPRGTAPFTYHWLLNGVVLPGQTSADLVMPGPAWLNGAKVQAFVSNQYGSSVSNPATLVVKPERAPTARINLPANVDRIKQGHVLRFSATAFDSARRPIPASRVSWTLDLLHNEHVHPGVFHLTGRKSGSVRLPVHAESGHVAFRLTLNVTDRDDNTATVSRVIDLGTNP